MTSVAVSPIKILHMEDDPADAQLCHRALRQEMPAVIIELARTGREFREKLQQSGSAYDVLLADFRVPDWNGLEAARWCRASGYTQPLILVTGTLGDELAVECLREGATDYCLKDRLNRLPMAIDRALQEQKLRLERDRVERSLQQRERDYRSIIDGAPFGIYRSDREGNILMANPALAAMLGYENATELLTLNTVRDVFADPASRQKAMARTTTDITFSEHPWRRKDGKQITVRIAGRRLPGTSGPDTIFELFVEDISEQRLLEQQFLQAQKMEAIGRLAGGVAHDFNNLLMIISSCVELLQEQRENPEKTSEYVQQIKDATSMAAFVVRQLLTFSRKQVTERQAVDLNYVLRDLGKMLPRLLGEDIEVVLVPTKGLQKVEVDRGHVEQVIMNLAVNARDAMPQGGKLVIETANIELNEKQGRSQGLKLAPGHYVTLTVTDTGTGMDPTIQARIFEPFFTTKERGKGTGLGLATVYAIIRQNGGEITVHSQLKRGSTFEVFFPIAVEKKETAAESADLAAPAGGTETILLVEDEAALRAITSEYLASKGYNVLVAANGIAALDTCRDHEGPIHVLLTDVVMPGVTGPEVARAVRELRPEVRVIYVSGYIDRQVDLDALGPDSVFLQKPYGLGDLGHRIRELCSTTKLPGRAGSELGNVRTR